MKWVKVKDRLPKEYQYVLVCDESDEINDWESPIAYAVFAPCGKGCCEPDFEIKTSNYLDNITHWMPLPNHVSLENVDAD